MNEPTRIGLISDIHGNHVALQAVLDDMGQVDGFVCAGDIVGYGPSPERCLQTIREQDIPTVQGNHDRKVAEGRGSESGDEYAQRVLDDEQRTWLDDLPRKRSLFDDRLKVVHDHPDERDRYTFPDQFEADLLGDEDVLVLGHTHFQHAEQLDSEIIVNPGSVGQPRDRDPAAAYAVVDLDGPSVDLFRVEYDIYRVEIRIRNSPIENRNGDRLAKGE